jgi:predicted unusual protein kinase regulating ubiquinone biosynthesis (AarF/ABC1/UbiB family)
MIKKINIDYDNLIFLFNLLIIFSNTIINFLYYNIFTTNIENNNIYYEKLFENLINKLASINILYVKIFQAIALNNKLINKSLNLKLLKMTDNAPYNNNDIDYELLLNIIKKYNLQIENIDKPINSGMISLVYIGITNEDPTKKIIIKIKRLNIDKKLEKSFKNLIFLNNIISIIPFISSLRLNDIIDENIELIKQQTNFLNEVKNMKLIKKNCKGLKYIIIPNVNEEATNEYKNVIIMDYLEGKRITDISLAEKEIYAKLLIKFGFVSSFLHGITHGDLHSGNIIYMKDKDNYKLGIIDYGIIYEFNLILRENILNICLDFINKEISSEEIMIKILYIMIEPKGILNNLNKKDYYNILNYGIDILNKLRNLRDVNQNYLFKFLNEFSKYLNKKYIKDLGIFINKDFLKIQLVITMSNSITLHLCDNKFFDLYKDTIDDLFPNKLLL